MAVGRNDPCPCGSGKKYKKCCMKKDAAARAERKGPEAGASLPPDRREDENASWANFQSQTHEGQVGVFMDSLENRELVEDGAAFEMLAAIVRAAMQRKEWDRAAAFIAALRERQPEVYEADAPTYLHWLAAVAIAAEDQDSLLVHARELGEKADKDVDVTHNAIRLLAYHGQLAALLELMRPAWPKMQEAPGLMGWVVPEFAAMLRWCETFHYIECTPSPDPADPELLRRIEFDADFDTSRLAPHFEALMGKHTRVWTLADFPVRRRRTRDGDEDEGWQLTPAGRENLRTLLLQFVGHARRTGVPYTRADLAADHLYDYIVDRLSGGLKPRESMLQAALRKAQGRPRPEYELRLPENLLCPDRETFERYLAGLLGFMNAQYHSAAAAAELLPAWLACLEEQGLLDPRLRDATLATMRGLNGQLADLCDRHCLDPLLGPSLRAAIPGEA